MDRVRWSARSVLEQLTTIPTLSSPGAESIPRVAVSSGSSAKKKLALQHSAPRVEQVVAVVVAVVVVVVVVVMVVMVVAMVVAMVVVVVVVVAVSKEWWL